MRVAVLPVVLRWTILAIVFAGGYYIGKAQVVAIEVEIPTTASQEERAGYIKMIQFLQNECMCWQKNYDAIAEENNQMRAAK